MKWHALGGQNLAHTTRLDGARTVYGRFARVFRTIGALRGRVRCGALLAESVRRWGNISGVAKSLISTYGERTILATPGVSVSFSRHVDFNRVLATEPSCRLLACPIRSPAVH
jgi:hypothetical protein